MRRRVQRRQKPSGSDQARALALPPHAQLAMFGCTQARAWHNTHSFFTYSNDAFRWLTNKSLSCALGERETLGTIMSVLHIVEHG
jgi:hypothetical protein